MSKIDIISASAGSGKTFTLTGLLKEEVDKGRARPGYVLATTFTKKAAAELQERVRTGLLKAGRIDDAQVLATARIGTVNSVCGGLVSSFAFVLGLPVQLKVIDEDQAELVLKRTLSRVVGHEEADELAALSYRWKELKWEQVVLELVDKARTNGIDAAGLQACAGRSLDDYMKFLGSSPAGADEVNRRLIDALAGLVNAADALSDPPDNTKKANRRAKRLLARLRSGEVLPWSEWLWISKINAGASVKKQAEKVRAVAGDPEDHPRMIADARRIIELAFSIAGRLLTAYQDYKRELGLIDFVDQEVLALELLKRRDIQERLRDEIDLILVDEFQDTSPLQLAVFLALSKLCDRSVWVGDQKQAIYAFRGTDPRLMDAAIKAILKGKEPETLKNSHRSRPELVRLTSDVFQDVFEPQGISKERGRLEPAEDTEPDGLGPIVERWVLSTKNKDDDADALAVGVRELLHGSKTRVRIKGRADTRDIRPCDVAVLCRTNPDCSTVADALERAGVRAAIPRPGLMQTAEARLILAGLKLWFDPKDRLALAELLRLARNTDDPDKWLAEVIKSAGDPDSLEFDLADRIRAARKASASAGPLQVFDAVAGAVRAREFCLSRGDSDGRLHNLDALREQVVRYLSGAAEGGAGTLGGLLAAFVRLLKEKKDSQATVADENAVVVSTWHGAKGLEWPVVVIHTLATDLKGDALGVKVIDPDKDFDFNDPLAGRWLRFWPKPYAKNTRHSTFHERLGTHDAAREAKESDARETLRLLYVCWTRARDRLVLPAREGKLTKGVLSLLESDGKQMIADVKADSGEAEAVWGGRKVKLQLKKLVPEEEVEKVVEPGEDYLPAGPREYPPAWENPSTMEGKGRAGDPETIGDRLNLTGSPDMEYLGEAVHGFLAADIDGLEQSRRRDIAAGLLDRWGVADCLTPDDLLKAGDKLKAWINKRWPGATWHREIPMSYKNDAGSIVRGICDLSLQTKDGWVVIDHKSYPGGRDEATDRAAKYASQLKAYADGIAAASKKPVLEQWIHLPLLGLAVPVESEMGEE